MGFSQRSAHYGAPKYVPKDGSKLLIIGQDLGAVGGLNSHANGYVDNLNQIPAGITTYTGISNLGGLKSQTNWGAGDVNGQAYLNDDTFDNSVIAIGLYISGSLGNINSGFLNNRITELGEWIKETERPVFLRIGYEFDGPWNGHDPTEFKQAWIHIVEIFDELDVRNVAYVWQSAGINTANIDRWYPGDEYVNWLAYSHFDGSNPGQSIRNFAIQHDKPIMIAEATPRQDLKTVNGQSVWLDWFQPLFDVFDDNDNILALAYINANWDAQSMWIGQGWGDSRIEVNDIVENSWLNEIEGNNWLLADEGNFDLMDYQLWQDSTYAITSVVGNPVSSSIQYWVEGPELVLHSNSGIEEIIVTTFSGQTILERLNSTNTDNIRLRLHPGNYIVQVKTRFNVEIKKLNLKNR